MYQVLVACGVDVDQVVPWVRPWFLRYQLPDGGLNCDEQAYAVQPAGRARYCRRCLARGDPLRGAAPLAAAEVRFLDEGARYLIERRWSGRSAARAR